MESSPETAPSPENSPVSSKPPPPPSLQENPSLTTAAPPEPAPPDHAAPSPSPPPGQVNEKSPAVEEPPALAPIDGTPRGAGPPPSLSPRNMATSESPALEAAASEEPTSPSPTPPHPVEVSPEAAAAAAVASPPPSPQIAEASPGDAPPPSPSPSHQASTSGALPDASFTDSVAMASEEAARPPPELESMDADLQTALAPPTPPLKSGPEELLPQQHPGCVNSEPAQLPPPSPSPVGTTYAVPDAAGAVAVTPEEPALSPPPALEATDGETDTAPAAPPAFVSAAEGSFQEPVTRSPSRPTEAEPSSPEMAPPGFEDFKSSWVPLSAPTLPVKTTHSLLDAAVTKAVAVPEEAAGSLPILEATDVKTEIAPGLTLPSLESGAEVEMQQPLLRPPSLITQAEPCSPDMRPPGFENFMSSWLPPPTPLAETTCASSDVVVAKAVGVTLEEAVWPVPALEVMKVETDTTPSLLPPPESKVEGLLEQPLSRPPTPVAQSAPCSPEMAPPGFENFKSSWPPLCTPLSGVAYILPDAAATDPLAMKLEEAARPPPALEAMDVDMDATQRLLLPLESGMEGSLQEPQSTPHPPTMQDAPCSPDMAPPGFENFKSSQRLLPSPPPVQTAYTLHDPATTEAAHLSEEASQPSPALEAMVLNMDTSPSMQPSSESGTEGSLPHHLPRLPSPKHKGTACSAEMVPSGHENLQSLQQLPLPALLPQVQTPDALVDVVATEAVIVSLEEVHHSPPVLGTMEEGTVPILPPPLESGSGGSLPQLESQAHSLKAQAVDTPQDAPATNPVAVKSGETAQPPPALEAMDTNMDSATTSVPLSENGAEGSLPQVQHQSPSPTAQAPPCSLDFLELLPPPPPPFLNKEMGQMVCGSCRDLLAYPRGAVHVQCAGCRTINLVLEAHEVGNVHCARCETLLMYPSGAPAVKCSLCLFITEIGERNVRPRVSAEQAVPPHLPEVTNQG